MRKTNGVSISSSFDLSDVTKSQARRSRKRVYFKPCRRGHTDGPHHNCAYVNAINKLIPEASRMADRRFADYVEAYGELNSLDARDLWSSLFMEEMQADAESEGLRRNAPSPSRNCWVPRRV